MKPVLKTSILFLVIIATIIGCRKEGIQGEPGTAGINGTNGTNGTNGNANVKSDTFTVYASQWVPTTDHIYFNKNSSLISQSIVDSGGVMLYMQPTSSNYWQALPYTIVYSSYLDFFSFGHDTGKIRIQVTNDLGSGVLSSVSTMKFKVIVFSSSALLSNPHIDFNDYYQVKGAFNLKD